jgi:MFS family permease
LLTCVSIMNYVDRQLIGILSPEIKREFMLSDWQLGLVKGVVFALLYTLLGIPIARLADRYNRVSIIGLALATWSGFTVISGLVGNFVQLALTRFAVSIGEAGGTAPIHSIVSDYYPKDKRAQALA